MVISRDEAMPCWSPSGLQARAGDGAFAVKSREVSATFPRSQPNAKMVSLASRRDSSAEETKQLHPGLHLSFSFTSCSQCCQASAASAAFWAGWTRWRAPTLGLESGGGDMAPYDPQL